MRLFTSITICAVAMAVWPFGAIAQSSGTYSLTVDKTSVSAGQSVTVTWQTSGTAGVRDWVGMYKTGASDTSYSSWQYVNSNTKTMAFTPQSAGTYEFRYFINNGYTKVANSPTVTVSSSSGGGGGGNGGGGNQTATLTIDQTAIDTGQAITVTLQTNGAVGGLDWIGLYKTGASQFNYESWKRIPASNNLSFTVNSPGDYEFRYFKNNSYTLEETSPSFTVTTPTGGGGGGGGNSNYTLTPDQSTYTVGDIASVNWSATNRQFLDWIGLYRTSDSDTAYTKYEYVDGFSFTETFRLDTTGTYEFRYFTRNSYNKVATSPTITVQAAGGGSNGQCTIDTSNVVNIPTGNGPIIALGDSLTFGIGATNGQNYVDELEKRLNITIQNAGVSGDTTVDALARLQQDVLSKNPSAVIVFLGGNDEIRRFYDSLSQSAADRNRSAQLDAIAANLGYDWRTKPLLTRSETFANLTTIISDIQATGAAVIVVGFNASIFNNSLNSQYRTLASDTGSIFVSDIYSGVFGRPSLMSDLVHPNNAGYDIFASRIQPAVVCVQ